MDSYICLLIFLLLIINNKCYDSPDHKIIRQKFFSKAVEFSQDQMEIIYDDEISKGTKCIATSYIPQNSEIIKVPNEYIISSFHIFPMKIEVFEIIYDIINVENFLTEMKKDERLSHYLLVLNLMYILFPHKSKIEKYLIDNNLNSYLNTYLKVNENISDSFPKIVFGLSMLEKGHFNLLRDKYLKDYSEQEFVNFHSKLINRVKTLKHKEAVIPWISDFDTFLYSYTLALNRSLGVPYKDFSKVLDQEMLIGRNEIEIKNNYLMKDNLKSINAILTFVDSCNHDERNQRKLSINDQTPLIIVDFNVNSFNLKSVIKYNYNDEIMFKYQANIDNRNLFIIYGFIIDENDDNKNELNFKDTFIMSIDKLMICERISCFDTRLDEMKSINYNDSKSIPEFKFYLIDSKEICKELLNYSFVRSLPTDMNYITINRAKEGIFDYNVKIDGYFFYIHKLRFFWRNFYYGMFKDSIKKSHQFFNLVSKEEKDGNHFKNIKKWQRIKNYQLIYDLDISIKRVTLKNLILAEKKAIALVYSKVKLLLTSNLY